MFTCHCEGVPSFCYYEELGDEAISVSLYLSL